jgi:hypothetical protein
MPAPVKATTCLPSAKSLAARLIKSSTTIYLKIAIMAAESNLSVQLIMSILHRQVVVGLAIIYYRRNPHTSFPRPALF